MVLERFEVFFELYGVVEHGPAGSSFMIRPGKKPHSADYR
jgi:hypothetical protein